MPSARASRKPTADEARAHLATMADDPAIASFLTATAAPITGGLRRFAAPPTMEEIDAGIAAAKRTHRPEPTTSPSDEALRILAKLADDPDIGAAAAVGVGLGRRR